MPDHGHGASKEAIVTPSGTDGMYDVDPVNLWMPGFWEVRFNVMAAGASDRIVFAFCIEG